MSVTVNLNCLVEKIVIINTSDTSVQEIENIVQDALVKSLKELQEHTEIEGAIITRLRDH